MFIYFVCLYRGAYHGGSPYTLGLTSVGLYKHGVANGFGCLTVRFLLFFVFKKIIWVTNSLLLNILSISTFSVLQVLYGH